MPSHTPLVFTIFLHWLGHWYSMYVIDPFRYQCKVGMRDHQNSQELKTQIQLKPKEQTKQLRPKLKGSIWRLHVQNIKNKHNPTDAERKWQRTKQNKAQTWKESQIIDYMCSKHQWLHAAENWLPQGSNCFEFFWLNFQLSTTRTSDRLFIHLIPEFFKTIDQQPAWKPGAPNSTCRIKAYTRLTDLGSQTPPWQCMTWTSFTKPTGII